MPDYVYQPYPAWRFHATLPAKIVDDAKADAALGPGWVDTPAKLLAPAPAPAAVAPPAPADPPSPKPLEIPAADSKPKPKPRAK